MALKAVRQRMIELGWCRNVVNRSVGRLKYVFKWTVSQELIPPTVHQSLAAVEGLKKGKSEARETKKIKPVAEAHIDAVLAVVSPTIKAMIELQLLTGMRSIELCIMRACDIDTSDDNLWAYRPQFHKTGHHGHDREVYLGARAREIIRPLMTTDLQRYLFSPKDAEAWRHAQAKTHRRLNQKRNPRKTEREVRDRYDRDSYGRAIAYGCKKADMKAREERRKKLAAAGIDLTPEQDLPIVPQWHPHQLRHNAGARFRRDYGLETAKCLLGQKTLDAAQLYAEQDVQRARQIMAQVG